MSGLRQGSRDEESHGQDILLLFPPVGYLLGELLRYKTSAILFKIFVNLSESSQKFPSIFIIDEDVPFVDASHHNMMESTGSMQQRP